VPLRCTRASSSCNTRLCDTRLCDTRLCDTRLCDTRPLTCTRYGAGDFINDYEGIDFRDGFRSDLTLGYFPLIDSASGKLIELTMRPLQMHRFRLRNASVEDAAWLASEMDRECRKLGARVKMLDESDGGGFVLALEW
jgi:hypothetical protein